MKKSSLSLAAAALAILAGIRPAQADTHTWNGAAITYNWSTPANWVGNNPPYPGEPSPVYIIFPAGAARLANYCNIANLTVDEISFTGSGYSIQMNPPGTAITLKNSIASIFCSGTNNVLGVPLILSATNLPIIVGKDDNLKLNSVLSGPGSFKKLGDGDLWISGGSGNTYLGPTTVLGGTLHLQKGGGFAVGGDLIIGDTNGPAFPNQFYDSVVMIEEGNQQWSYSAAVTVNPDANLNLKSYGQAVGSLNLIGDCQVDGYAGSGVLTLLGNLSASALSPLGGAAPYVGCDLSLGGATRTFNIGSGYFEIVGTISSGGGNAGIIQTGSYYGSTVLTANNSYTGTTTISNGTIYVSGLQPGSPVVIDPSGILAGSGSVGTVNCQGGQMYPQPQYSSRNMISKDLTLNSASTFGVTLDHFQTIAAPAFLTVNGTVNLGGCQFYGVFYTNSTFAPGIGTQFLIIQNDGNDAVNGTFAGLPEGKQFKFGGRLWQITYKGGTGNDVVLMQLSVQLPLSTDYLVNDSVSGWTTVYGTGTPNVIYELHASTNLVNWEKVDDAWNDNGTLSGKDNSWWSGAPQCFYRFYKP